MTGDRSRPLSAGLVLGVGFLTVSVGGAATLHPVPERGPWGMLIAQAEAMGLPTRFIRAIDPGLVRLEFDDLHAFAAEYHPGEHVMVLNRSLSFNAAGGTLRPLSKLTHQELGTLYHELFHAYLDSMLSDPAHPGRDPDGARLLAFARMQQACRYRQVLITPVVQRKAATESRFLTEGESWEAMNETWAVFIGWAVWTRLELGGAKGQRGGTGFAGEAWRERLRKADREGILVGYYEPEDPGERTITRKRYLAPSERLSPGEATILAEVILGDTPEVAKRGASVMQASTRPVGGGGGKDACPAP